MKGQREMKGLIGGLVKMQQVLNVGETGDDSGNDHEVEGVDVDVASSSMANVAKAIQTLSNRSIPTLLKTVEQQQRRSIEAKRDLDQYKEQLESTKEEITKKEKEWEGRHQTRSNDVQLIEKELDRLEREVGRKEQELKDTSSRLLKNRQDLNEADQELTNVSVELGEKHLELSEVNRLCEERVRAAHTIECSAQISLKETQQKQREMDTQRKRGRETGRERE